MTSLDPATFTTKELTTMDTFTLHHLAVRACGTLTAYRLLLGRCLVAIGQTDGHYEYGCSSAIHYATRVLGMPKKEARTLRYVARHLEGLAKLSQHAAQGTIEWSKLREVVRVASAETEAHWIELCANHSYAQIEKLVALTPYGQLPGDCKAERVRSQLTELHCTLEAEAMVIVERGLQSMCQEAGKVLSLAEGIEYLFAEYLAKRPLDEAALEKARKEARQDLETEQQREEQLLDKCPARDICPGKFPETRISESIRPATQGAERDILEWTDTVEAEPEPCPGNAEVGLVKRNPRVPGPSCASSCCAGMVIAAPPRAARIHCSYTLITLFFTARTAKLCLKTRWSFARAAIATSSCPIRHRSTQPRPERPVPEAQR